MVPILSHYTPGAILQLERSLCLNVFYPYYGASMTTIIECLPWRIVSIIREIHVNLVPQLQVCSSSLLFTCLDLLPDLS